jgi:hypothetical protein
MAFSVYAAGRVCFCLALEAATSAESLCRVVAHDLLASADLLHLTYRLDSGSHAHLDISNLGAQILNVILRHQLCAGF